MILRRYLCIVAVASLGAICAHAQSDGFSLGALDFIGKSASGVSPLGALEEVSANSAAESRDTGGGDMAVPTVAAGWDLSPPRAERTA